MANVLNSPVVIGILIGLPGFALTYLGLKRAKKADAVTEKAGAVDQIIDGLNKLTVNLQADNDDLRGTVKDLSSKLLKTTGERDKLKKQVYYLQRKYGDKGKNN